MKKELEWVGKDEIKDCNVGIATTNSQNKLEVVGNIRTTGNLITSAGGIFVTANIPDSLNTIEQDVINGTKGNIGCVFGGDIYVASHWGFNININQGGFGDSVDAGRTNFLN
jgi:hypothetical protein